MPLNAFSTTQVEKLRRMQLSRICSLKFLPIPAKYANGRSAGFRWRTETFDHILVRMRSLQVIDRDIERMTYNSDRISLMVEHGDFHTNPPYLSSIVCDLKMGWREIETKRRRERERRGEKRSYQFWTFSSANLPNCWHSTPHSEGYMCAIFAATWTSLVHTCTTSSNGFVCVSQYLSMKTGMGY